MSTSCDGARVDCRWKPLREGEMSPFKMLVALFIREVYAASGSERKDSEGRAIAPKTLLLIYNLISSFDMDTFPELKSTLEKPIHAVRPEALKKFNRIIANLEPNNSYFLYELANSIVSMESSQMVVLKKRISKNSPFGKFLRGIYLNVKKLSYPQVDYMYKQLLHYLGIIPGEGGHPHVHTTPSRSGKDKDKIPRVLKGLDLFQKLEERKDGEGLDLEVFHTYMMEYKKMMGSASESEKSSYEIHSDWKNAKAKSAAERAAGCLRKLWQSPKTHRTNKNEKDEYIMSSSSASVSTATTIATPIPMMSSDDEGEKDITGEGGLSAAKSHSASAARRSPRSHREQQDSIKRITRSSSSPIGKGGGNSETTNSLRRIYFSSPSAATTLATPLPMMSSDDDGEHEVKGQDRSSAIKSQSSAVRRSPRSQAEQPVSIKRITRSSSSPIGKGKPGKRRSSSLRRIYFSSPRPNTSLGFSRPQLQLTPIKHISSNQPKKVSSSLPTTTPTPSTDELHGEGWNVIKRWSRKQIERAVKSLMDRLYSANAGVPSPSEVTLFVRVALTNPSGSVLFPHLHYLEYLNCLRIKDVARCTDSLRASFDVRIKPNTTELNKGTTYAAYNAALFYHQIGYKDDAISSLDEAFRAGHAAGDATCLHHCHNLWSSFHSRSYKDAIVTVTKEVDNNMAYLHSLNVIVNAFDVHSRGLTPDETLHSLWHYNADCDLEEMEGLLLSALSNLYAIYGWHEMIAFPAQMVLCANWKWSSRFYAFALCSLSQCLLYHADVQASDELMEYGRKIFEFDASLAGQHFLLQHAIFQALKSYLAYEPVNTRILGTISAFDEVEGVYWRAYNLMITNNFREATTLLCKFMKYLDKKEDTKGYLGTDLELRCFLLLAELECLCLNPSGAVSYLSDALEIATSIHSDVYITLCLYNAAAVQCVIGLEKTSFLTLEKKVRSAIRCASPWLKSRMNVVKAKIIMKVEKTVTQEKRLEIMALLNESELLYQRWGNNYRLMEILEAKAELLERSSDLEQDGSEYRKMLEEIDSGMEWTKETCIL